MDWIRHLLTSKYLYLALTVIVAAGALTVYALDRWIMPSYTNYFEGLTVPDVTKLPLEEAEATLELYGLRHEILDQRTHSAYPARSEERRVGNVQRLGWRTRVTKGRCT